jgi:hypothetical protein
MAILCMKNHLAALLYKIKPLLGDLKEENKNFE